MTTVAEAQQAARAAEIGLKAAQRQEAKEQDRKVVAEGRRVKRNLDRLVGDIEKAKGRELLVEAELARTNDGIRQAQLALRGTGDDFAVSERDRAGTQKELDRLLALRPTVVERLRDARRETAVLTQDAIRLDKALTRLRYQHRNLQTILGGGDVPLSEWEGGVTSVA